MSEKTKRKKWFENVKMPHTYVILITILVIMTILTHIIPAGQYQRVEDPVSGTTVVVPDSFEFVDVDAPGFFDIFLSLQRGYVDAADIMFLIIFAYGFVFMLVKNGTMDAALGTLVRLVGKKIQLMIPITMIVLGLLSSTMGIFEEVYGLFPVFVGIAVALWWWEEPSSIWALRLATRPVRLTPTPSELPKTWRACLFTPVWGLESQF